MFDFIQFDEKTHRYFNTNTGKYVPSVTSIISKLYTFDKAYHLKRKASKLNITPEELEKQWDTKRDNAANKGKVFHKYMEDRLLNRPTDIENYVAESYLATYKNDVSLHCEMVVGNHLIAGTLDNLSLRDGKYILKDWKTNEKFTTESEYNLAKPFAYLDTSKFTLYALQLSLYRYLLDIPIYRMEVIHFTDTDYKVYTLPYMEREVWQIIKQLEHDNRATYSSSTRIDPSILRE